MPLTDGQLQGQRDTFWDTAPIYEGRKEIWDALRAACQAVEESDFELAQGILDGANINLPTGKYSIQCYISMLLLCCIVQCILHPTCVYCFALLNVIHMFIQRLFACLCT